MGFTRILVFGAGAHETLASPIAKAGNAAALMKSNKSNSPRPMIVQIRREFFPYFEYRSGPTHLTSYLLKQLVAMLRSLHLLTLILPLAFCAKMQAQVDFNTEVRPILSNKCLLCHGPDEESVESGLQLHQRDLAIAEADSGEKAIVPGNASASELIARIVTDDEDIRMPPADHGKALTNAEVDILKQWITEGAQYDQHWAYSPATKSPLPIVPQEWNHWPQNAIDHFVLQQQIKRNLIPSKPADRRALARRVALDLTGLPLTVEEVESFAASDDPSAYEKLIDNLMARPTFGEHWARKWLDLARYADSAGYADDPSRTIWAYRDWVIRSMNDNMPFDQFTREQIAGDLLPNPSEDQLVATAFHRNTMTNNEGGTQDEEFRAAAIVDRVNTTMAVWMGTTMACAQCHTHKYDPLTQEEYFQFYAVFNNTEDADRRNESPTLPLFTEQQKQNKTKWQQSVASLKKQLNTPTEELEREQLAWENELRRNIEWKSVLPNKAFRTSGQELKIAADGTLTVESEAIETIPLKDTYVIDLPMDDNQRVSAIQLSTTPDEKLPNGGSGWGGGNFVVTGISAEWIPAKPTTTPARYVRIVQHGKKQILSLAEVEVFSDSQNVAIKKKATQSSTYISADASRAVDGTTDGDYENGSVSHSSTEDNPWWQLDLGSTFPVERLTIWNRTDNNLQKRLNDFSVVLMDEDQKEIWSQRIKKAPRPSVDLKPDGSRNITFRSAVADYHQPGFLPEEALTGITERESGWAIGGSTKQAHQLIASLSEDLHTKSAGNLRITIQQQSPHHRHLMGRFQLAITDSPLASVRGSVPSNFLAIADKERTQRTEHESSQLASYFRLEIAPSSEQLRNELIQVQQKLADLKPATSVPILREMTSNRRITNVHHRGSYLDLGKQVEPGIPKVFLTSTSTEPTAGPRDRLQVADWLVSRSNPLTARVLVNRYWESIFGRGIVVTSEEFGSQGELPTHPKLLDWLAVEMMDSGWDRKHLLKLLVMSAAYQQSSKVTPALAKADSANLWLARGPRVRHSAEMVRDQTLFVSGLLSKKMFGAPVNPPQPDLGLKAAFGSSTDWKTSTGEDRYRRGIYTTWRRSNPYPSMATFDAPNREVCTVRRNSTNTPLQSLVTLNDPVYVEAAQSLARLAMQQSPDVPTQIKFAFQRCVQRPASEVEIATLVSLYTDSVKDFTGKQTDAEKLATEPLGPLPPELKPIPAAAMTVVCNILLNLDEMFLKR